MNQELLTNNIKPASGSGLDNSFQPVETATASAVEVAGNITASSTVTTTAKVLYILQSTGGDGDSVNTSKLSDDSGCDSKIIKNLNATINRR